MTIKTQLAREFKLRNLQWQHTYVDDFAISQWQDFMDETDPWFVTYRVVHFITYIIIIIIFCAARCQDISTYTNKHMVYLSSWIHVVATLNSMFGVICILYEKWVWRCSKWIGFTVAIFPMSHRIYWILHSTSLDLVFAVCIYYWIYRSVATESETFFNNAYHVWILMLSIVDLYMVSIPLKLLHVYSSILLFILYIIFNYCYVTAGFTSPYGNTYIYKILNWNVNSSKAAWMAVLGVVILLIARLIVWVLMKIRKCASKIFLKDVGGLSTSGSITNVFSSSF